MAKKVVVFIVLFISTAFFTNVIGPCLAQAADNTKVAKRDAYREGLTADQQGETKQDREITKKIRRVVVNDKSLSMDAHNVKIITVGGIVTLKGPVRSEKEKKVIEDKAAEIAGSDNIRSEMNIVPE